jgi:hypothetical protein
MSCFFLALDTLGSLPLARDRADVNHFGRPQIFKELLLEEARGRGRRSSIALGSWSRSPAITFFQNQVSVSGDVKGFDSPWFFLYVNESKGHCTCCVMIAGFLALAIRDF